MSEKKHIPSTSRWAYMLGRGLYLGAELIADIHFLLAADTRRYISRGVLINGL